jgi:hypothetical protein
MKFKNETMTQGRLAKLFVDTSSHDVGRWLCSVGLRDPQTKKPTRKAHDEGYCQTDSSGQFYQWVWNSQKTVTALQAAGHKMLPDPPEDLIEVGPLCGPFTISGNEVVSADGSLAARASNRTNAEVLLRLLQMAHKTGAIDRLLTLVSAAS